MALRNRPTMTWALCLHWMIWKLDWGTVSMSFRAWPLRETFLLRYHSISIPATLKSIQTHRKSIIRIENFRYYFPSKPSLFYSQSECSEGDGGDVTPCNLSPCIIGPMASATPPSFMTPEDTATQPHSSLEDIDPTWRTHFQLLVTEGGPSQLVSSLHYLPKLFRVIFVPMSQKGLFSFPHDWLSFFSILVF